MSVLDHLRCALFDDPPTPLTVVQKEISRHGWRPDKGHIAQAIWDARYSALRSVEDKLLAMERRAVKAKGEAV